MADRAHLERLLRAAIDEGRVIEVGWLSMRISIMPANCSKVQLQEMRKAYFLGAQHLFTCMTQIVPEGAESEPSEKEMQRMSMIHAELEAFVTEFKASHP